VPWPDTVIFLKTKCHLNDLMNIGIVICDLSIRDVVKKIESNSYLIVLEHCTGVVDLSITF